MERISTINEISERVDLTCRSIVIVGAHINGKRICKYLLSHNINVKCFIDEDPKKFHTNYLGIPILSPKEYVLNVVDVIIICISSFNSLSNEKILQKPIVKKLKAIKNQIFLLDRTITALQLLKEHFSKIPYLDTNADILVFNSLKLPNYLKMGDSVARCFLEQVGDLILPEYFLDCSLIDEVPYEWPSSLSDIENLQEKCVLDCGANIGLFSAIAASKGFLVYAFEPIPDSQKILEKVKSLYPDKIHICPYALSDFNGRVFMSNNSDLISI